MFRLIIALLVVAFAAASCPVGTVTKFILWDSVVDKPLFEIKDQQIICSNVTSYNIEAVVDSCTVGSVGSVSMSIVTFKGTNQATAVEKRGSYFLFGDFKGEIGGSGEPLPLKRFTLSATPYSAKGGNGQAGTGKSINFKVSCKAPRLRN